VLDGITVPGQAVKAERDHANCLRLPILLLLVPPVVVIVVTVLGLWVAVQTLTLPQGVETFLWNTVQAALVLAVIIQAITFFLILVALNSSIPAINPLTLLSWAILNVLDLIVKIYFWSVIAVVVVSWIAPQSGHPAIQLVAQITEPVMRPVRNVMPSMGGLDLSPIIVFLILNVVSVVIDHMKVAAGMGSIVGM